MEKEIEQEIEKAFEDHVEKKVEEKVKKAFKKKSPAARRVGYVFALAFSILFLWIVNNIENWTVQWVTQSWDNVLPWLQVSAVVNIAVYVAFFFHDSRGFFYVGRLALDGLGIAVSVRLFQVYPFDFQYLFGGWSWLNPVGRVLLVIGIVGIGIAIILRTVRLCTGKNIYD